MLHAQRACQARWTAPYLPGVPAQLLNVKRSLCAAASSRQLPCNGCRACVVHASLPHGSSQTVRERTCFTRDDLRSAGSASKRSLCMSCACMSWFAAGATPADVLLPLSAKLTSQSDRLYLPNNALQARYLHQHTCVHTCKSCRCIVLDTMTQATHHCQVYATAPIDLHSRSRALHCCRHQIEVLQQHHELVYAGSDPESLISLHATHRCPGINVVIYRVSIMLCSGHS